MLVLSPFRLSGLALMLFFAKVTEAQPVFVRNDTVPVIVSGNKLKMPWSGGLNFCQFSSIDLDQDGVKDLFIFDRCSPGVNKISTFLSKGVPGAADYVYAPQYREKFPPLSYWAILRDYNGDGKEDIFTSSNAGIAVYKNESDANGLKFSLVNPWLHSDYKPNIISLYITSVDIPTIDDIDNDGDLDILTFEVGGSTMEYHKNISRELYGHSDSLEFEMETACWGMFFENALGCKITMNHHCHVKNKPDQVHAGSCSFCLDLDGDNDKEIVLGDLSCNTLTSLTNGGTVTDAFMVAQDSAFPASDTNTLAVNMGIFPCGYYLDIDNDQVKDLIVSPNSANISNNFTSIWYYKNTGLNNKPVFEYKQNNFLQSEMIETGEGAYPVFFDYDADGLLDLFIGNFGYYTPGAHQSKISLYRNTGTASSPQFELVTRDYIGLSGYSLANLVPAFGDIDGDGDDDMLIGDSEGKLHLFPNTAGAGNPVAWGGIQPNYAGIDVGHYAAPQIIDVDRDGMNDLLIGNRNGRLSYYKNTGSVFNLVTSVFGGVNVTKASFITGYSYPFIFDHEGAYNLMVGSESGWIYLYGNIDGNLSGNFTLSDSAYMKIWDGPRSSVHGADINNDGYLDLILGNYGGGVSFFSGQPDVSVHGNKSRNPAVFELFPNPAGGYVEIRFAGVAEERIKNIFITDLTGKLVAEISFGGSVYRMDVSGISPGMYLIRAEIKDDLSVAGYCKRFVIIR